MISRAAAIVFVLLAFIGAAFAQNPYPPGPPPPVPGLPDSQRQTTYTISGTACACAVGFQLYGDSTDYQSWIEVWLNGVQVQYNDPTYGWSLASPTGPFATIPRPITDAVLTFNNVQTGTVVIVSARRPRRTTEFTEGVGVPARSLNQTFNDIYAIAREIWDKINDVAGRGFFVAPGNIAGKLPLPASCANSLWAWDGTGLNPYCVPLSFAPSLTNFAILATSASGNNYTSFTCGQAVRRSNSGAAMTDTLPSTPPASGCLYFVENADSAALEAVQTSGGVLLDGIANGFTILGPGQGTIIQSDGSKYTSLTKPGRTKLRAGTSFYVAASGCSDNNPGITSGSPWCTLQHAWNFIQGNVDISSQTAIVQLADGTYAQGVIGAGTVSGQQEASTILFQGDCTTPTNVIVNGGGTSPFVTDDRGEYGIACMEVTTNVSGGVNLVYAQHAGSLIVINQKIVFSGGSVTGALMLATLNGGIAIGNGFTVTGGGVAMFETSQGGTITAFAPSTVTNSGTVTYSTATALATDGGLMAISDISFNGGCNGPRYSATTGSVINTGGGGANFLCGSSGGSAPTGYYE